MSHPEPVSPMMTTTLFLATASTIWSSYWLIGRSLRASMLWALGLGRQIQCTRDMLHIDTCKICKTESNTFMNSTPRNPGKYISMWPCHFQRCKYVCLPDGHYHLHNTISRKLYLHCSFTLFKEVSPKLALDSLRVYEASIFTDRWYLPSISCAIQHHALASIITPSRKFQTQRCSIMRIGLLLRMMFQI